ncbi:MAG TPA: type II toxin-antitoxin system PrlF family antitoxin [Stellaceae bacterium]|nr:type II toxin-antitoxin system PrlF family antitoxin [Stellaceae bacterium]
MEAAITSKGQVTIPKPIREHLHVKPGDRVKFFIHPDGTVVMLPKLPITALRGLLRWRGRPATLEEMDEAIAAGASERNLPEKKL